PARRQDLPAEGPADSDRTAVGSRHRRLPAPDSAAREDDERGPAGDRPDRTVRAESRHRRGLRARHPGHAGRSELPRRRAQVPGDRMRLNESVVISAPPKLVWDYVVDPANALHYMSGVTRWEVKSEKPIGLGARYRVLFK